MLPNVNCAYICRLTANKDIAFPKFSEQLTYNIIDSEINRSDKEIHTPYGSILLRNMSDPDSIIGYEVGYSLIDETDILVRTNESSFYENNRA
jgi:hypothetical protein